MILLQIRLIPELNSLIDLFAAFNCLYQCIVNFILFLTQSYQENLYRKQSMFRMEQFYDTFQRFFASKLESFSPLGQCKFIFGMDSCFNSKWTRSLWQLLLTCKRLVCVYQSESNEFGGECLKPPLRPHDFERASDFNVFVDV